jgi:hypothetical protein
MREVVMIELLKCRGMEELCRQRAVFFPEESWKWLAEAEMWNQKAFERSNQAEQSKVATSENSSVREKTFSRGRLPSHGNVPKAVRGAYVSKTTEVSRKPSNGTVAAAGSRKDKSRLLHSASGHFVKMVR